MRLDLRKVKVYYKCLNCSFENKRSYSLIKDNSIIKCENCKTKFSFREVKHKDIRIDFGRQLMVPKDEK